jgi:hypothetical protein
MSITDVCTAIATIGDGITGITTAYSTPPAGLDTAQLPALYPLTGRAEYDNRSVGADAFIIRRFYRVQVAVIPVGQGTPNEIESRCRALIDAVRKAFAKQPQLDRVSTVQNSIPVADTGIVRLEEYGSKFIGFDMTLMVDEIEARSYEE